MGDKKYVVTAPYVTLKTMTLQGPRVLGFMAGAPVPADVPEHQIKHHLDNHMIAEVEDPEAVGDPSLTPLEAHHLTYKDGDVPGVDVAETDTVMEAQYQRVAGAEAARVRSRAGKKAAETRQEREKNEGQGSGQAAAPVVAPSPSAPAGGAAAAKPEGK